MPRISRGPCWCSQASCCSLGNAHQASAPVRIIAAFTWNVKSDRSSRTCNNVDNNLRHGERDAGAVRSPHWASARGAIFQPDQLEIEDDTMPLLNSLRNPAVRAWWFYVPVLAAFAVVTCAIWAPFGWRISGTFEEWAVMVRADQLGTLSQLVVYPLNRPLFQAPMAIAH